MKNEASQSKTPNRVGDAKSVQDEPELFHLTDEAALAGLKVLLSIDRNYEAQKEKERGNSNDSPTEEREREVQA